MVGRRSFPFGMTYFSGDMLVLGSVAFSTSTGLWPLFIFENFCKCQPLGCNCSENERMEPLKINVWKIYSLLKVRPFLGDEFVRFRGCFFVGSNEFFFFFWTPPKPQNISIFLGLNADFMGILATPPKK